MPVDRDDTPSDIAPNDIAPTSRRASANPPTARQRTGAQHAARRVLDALAPERQPTRYRASQQPGSAVRQYRSPRGCILQGAARAVSVSWYPGNLSDLQFGELQVIAWAGVVSRPGASRSAAGGARVLAECRFRPVESSGPEWGWRGLDGDELSTSAVVAHCLDGLDADLGCSAGGAGRAGAGPA